LNEFDQFVKHKLNVKHYFRYTDDFIILHQNENYLKVLLPEVAEFLRERLKLNLHPNKVILKKLRQGVDFLGYVVLPYHRVLRTKTKRRILKKVNAKNLQSYLGILKHCNAFEIKQKILNKMSKAEELEKLKKEMEADKSLPLLGTANLVFGEGRPDAEIIFIGEAPGFHEDKLSRPFVGQAGKLLDKLLAGIKWPRESVYITNIVKRRPPENRDPLPEEIEAYKPYLKKQIQIIDPKIIATLGRFSMNYFLPSAKISLGHGKGVIIKSKIIYPLYHPAAALRSTQVLKELENDFKKLPALLDANRGGPELLKSIENVKAEETIPKAPAQSSLF